MAGGHGGARVPSSPAVTSGPGQLSRRTDGQVQAEFTGGAYGEAQDMRAVQGGARMGADGAAAAAAGAAGGSDLGALLAGLTGFDAASGAPDEPVTAGAAAGAGAGPESLGLPTDAVSERSADAKAIPEGQLRAMIRASQQPGATPSFKRYVRELVASR